MVNFVVKLDHEVFEGHVCQQTWPLNARWSRLATKLTILNKNKIIAVKFSQISSNFHQFDDDLNCKPQIKM